MSDLIPDDLRQLRACMICSLVKNHKQFMATGCENCDEFVEMKNNNHNISMCTTTSFEGMLAMMIPSESWVARWQRIPKFTPGMYAIAVHGNLPADILHDLESVGYKYHPRYPT